MLKMRLLHEIEADEVLLARGQYHYLRGGDPTGQTETWQISRLPDGSEVVRAEIKGYEGLEDSSLINLLTHYQRDPDGRPQWLRIRHERGELVAAAQYTFDQATVQIVRQAEGYPRHQDTIDIATGYEVDYHAVIAHDYVWRGYPKHARGRAWAMPIISPDLWATGDDMLKGRVLRFSVQPKEDMLCSVPADEFDGAQHFEITLPDSVHALAWFTGDGIPLRWVYSEKDFDFTLVSLWRAAEPD